MTPQATVSKASHQQTAKSNGTPPPQTKVSTASIARTEEETPGFHNLRTYLIGKECTLYSPPDHWFTSTYCDVKRPGEDFGRFPCTILDVVTDEKSGLPKSAIIQYRERNARVYGTRDCIDLEGISISVSYILPTVKDDVEAAISSEETSVKH